jgi:hypothetical protein
MDSKARRQLAMAAALRSTTTSRGLPCRSSAAPTAPTSPTGPAGLAALRVPRVGVGPGRGVLDGGAPDAGDVLADGRRGRPQRRAEAAVPRPGRRGELRDSAPSLRRLQATAACRHSTREATGPSQGGRRVHPQPWLAARLPQPGRGAESHPHRPCIKNRGRRRLRERMEATADLLEDGGVSSNKLASIITPWWGEFFGVG